MEKIQSSTADREGKEGLTDEEKLSTKCVYLC